MTKWWPRICFVAGALLGELVYQWGGGESLRIVGVIMAIVLGLLYALHRVDKYNFWGKYGYPIAAGFVAWAFVRLLIWLVASNGHMFGGAAS